jgi:hypothetical protein
MNYIAANVLTHKKRSYTVQLRGEKRDKTSFLPSLSSNSKTHFDFTKEAKNETWYTMMDSTTTRSSIGTSESTYAKYDERTERVNVIVAEPMNPTPDAINRVARRRRAPPGQWVVSHDLCLYFN